MYTIKPLRLEPPDQDDFIPYESTEFADADAWAHLAHKDTGGRAVGIWLDEGEGPFLYAVVIDGWTYIRWEN